MKVPLAGATGAIGVPLVRALRGADHHITVHRLRLRIRRSWPDADHRERHFRSGHRQPARPGGAGLRRRAGQVLDDPDVEGVALRYGLFYGRDGVLAGGASPEPR